MKIAQSFLNAQNCPVIKGSKKQKSSLASPAGKAGFRMELSLGFDGPLIKVSCFRIMQK